MRKYGLRMAGLCMAAALSVMAFAAASAQAEVGSHWNVNGSAISATLLPVPEAELTKTSGSLHGVLLSKILGSKFEILCTAVHFKEAVLKSEGGSLGKIEFTGCVELVGGVLQPACEPHTGTQKGVIVTKLLKDLIVLVAGGVAGEGYDRLEPEEGSTFTTVESSEECSVGEKVPVIGKFIFQDCGATSENPAACTTHEGKVEKVKHFTREGPGTELWVISKTEEHKATIDGGAEVFLTGSHVGLKWSGTPA
jgi:hypothetical protein